MTKQAIVDGIRDLSTDEKLDILYHLWDEIGDCQCGAGGGRRAAGPYLQAFHGMVLPL